MPTGARSDASWSWKGRVHEQLDGPGIGLCRPPADCAVGQRAGAIGDRRKSAGYICTYADRGIRVAAAPCFHAFGRNAASVHRGGHRNLFPGRGVQCRRRRRLSHWRTGGRGGGVQPARRTWLGLGSSLSGRRQRIWGGMAVCPGLVAGQTGSRRSRVHPHAEFHCRCDHRLPRQRSVSFTAIRQQCHASGARGGGVVSADAAGHPAQWFPAGNRVARCLCLLDPPHACRSRRRLGRVEPPVLPRGRCLGPADHHSGHGALRCGWRSGRRRARARATVSFHRRVLSRLRVHRYGRGTARP